MMNDFLHGYLDAIDFTADSDIRDAELAPEAKARAETDCDAFRDQAGDLLADADSHDAGADFWFTRNGHGTGFWDREDAYGKDNAARLTDIAHQFGEIEPYLGDDGLVYFSGGVIHPRTSGAA